MYCLCQQDRRAVYHVPAIYNVCLCIVHILDVGRCCTSGLLVHRSVIYIAFLASHSHSIDNYLCYDAIICSDTYLWMKHGNIHLRL